MTTKDDIGIESHGNQWYVYTAAYTPEDSTYLHPDLCFHETVHWYGSLMEAVEITNQYLKKGAV